MLFGRRSEILPNKKIPVIEKQGILVVWVKEAKEIGLYKKGFVYDRRETWSENLIGGYSKGAYPTYFNDSPEPVLKFEDLIEDDKFILEKALGGPKSALLPDPPLLLYRKKYWLLPDGNFVVKGYFWHEHELEPSSPEDRFAISINEYNKSQREAMNVVTQKGDFPAHFANEECFMRWYKPYKGR